jgi:hypothetical protein
VRKVFGIILIVAVLVPVALVVTACGNRTHRQSDPTICPQLEVQIRRAHANAHRDVRFRNVFVRNYLGTYNGSSVVRISVVGIWHTSEAWRETAGDIVFVTGQPRIIVFNNGEFATLNDAYDRGLLSLANLRAIARIHYGAHQNSDTTICPFLEFRVRRSFADKYSGHGATFENTYIARYYGTYDGSSVVYVWSTEIHALKDMWPHEIGGVRFNAQFFADVWRADGISLLRGNFIGINDAYELGYLSVADLQAIANIHNGVNYRQAENFMLPLDEIVRIDTFEALVSFLDKHEPDHMPIPSYHGYLLDIYTTQFFQARSLLFVDIGYTFGTARVDGITSDGVINITQFIWRSGCEHGCCPVIDPPAPFLLIVSFNKNFDPPSWSTNIYTITASLCPSEL